MTQKTGNKSSLYKLLDIRTDSGKIWLLLIPPVYTLWLLAIGKRLLVKQHKSDKIFLFFAWGTLLLFAALFLIMPFVRIDPGFTDKIVITIILTFYFFWFVTLGMLTNITIKYERLATPDKYYTIADNIAYLKRFFGFIYWPISIWWYQKTVNEYNQ